MLNQLSSENIAVAMALMGQEIQHMDSRARIGQKILDDLKTAVVDAIMHPPNGRSVVSTAGG